MSKKTAAAITRLETSVDALESNHRVYLAEYERIWAEAEDTLRRADETAV